MQNKQKTDTAVQAHHTPEIRDLEVRTLVTQMIKAAPSSRASICDTLSAIVGYPITVYMLDSYTAPSRDRNHFPAYLVKPFCELLNDCRLQRLLLSRRQWRLLEWAEMNLDVAVSLKKIEAARQTLLTDLGDNDSKEAF